MSEPGDTRAAAGRMTDPRAVRVALAPSSAHAGLPPLVAEPPAVPVAPARRVAGLGVVGGAAEPAVPLPDVAPAAVLLVDGEPVAASLARIDDARARLDLGSLSAAGRDGTESLPAETGRHRVLLGARGPGSVPGATQREVVVDGWRILVEVESERRATLRERARRGRNETARGGPTEVRAIIPGRVVAVSVVPGDGVTAGQQLLVVEAMKMQNELRAPREGTVGQVAVAPGRTIEVGDLLLVLE